MSYWAEKMQDDVFLISAEGWEEAAKPRALRRDRQYRQRQAEVRGS